MSGPFIKGWCPTVFEPMAASDGLLAGLKPPVKGWLAADLRVIAAAVEAHGSGQCLLTNRGNLQVRGLTAASTGAFAAHIIGAGLAGESADAERRRNILITRSRTNESQAIATQLESWLQSASALAGLPAKFSFCVTARAHHEDCSTADICVHVIGSEIWVVPGGAELGSLTHEPIAAVESLSRAFLRLAPRAGGVRRMRDLIAQVGVDTLFREAQLSQLSFASSPPIGQRCDVGVLSDEQFALGIPFGRSDVERLRTVASLAERFTDGTLRLTPRRAWLFAGVRSGSVERLSAAAQAAGFIVNAQDSRLRVSACVGGSGCAFAPVDMHALATELAPHWRSEGMLHLSGCSKGCAHPRAATLTVVAGAPSHRFHLMHDSRADGVPELALPVAALRAYLSDFARERSL